MSGVLVAGTAGALALDGALGAVAPPWRWDAAGWVRELALKGALAVAVAAAAG